MSDHTTPPGTRQASRIIPNSTQTPNLYLDEYMAFLSGEEFKVLAYTVRRTFGFQRQSDRITIKQYATGLVKGETRYDNGCGLREQTVRDTLAALISIGLIVKLNEPTQHEGAEYGLCLEPSPKILETLHQRQQDIALINRKRTRGLKNSKVQGSRVTLGVTCDDTPGVTSHDTPGVTSHDTPGVTSHDTPGVTCDVTLLETKIETKEETKSLSPAPSVTVETPPVPPVPVPEESPVQRDDTRDAINVSHSALPESPPPDEPDPPRAPHPVGYYAVFDDREMYGPFNNPHACTEFINTRGGGRLTETPPADLDAIAPAKPGKRTKDAAPGEAPKRDALFKAVARYLSFPDETVTAQYSAVKCRRVNQVKGYVLDVAGRPAKPDYAALAAKLDAFPAWCQNQGFTAPKEETKFTGQFNKFYHNGTGAAALRVAFPVEDFDKRWFNDRHSWYKREGGALLAQSIGATDWRKAREDE